MNYCGISRDGAKDDFAIRWAEGSQRWIRESLHPDLMHFKWDKLSHSVEAPSSTEVIVKGIDKARVHQVAANIRAIRPVEVYKGNGIRYEGEQVAIKAAIL